MIGRTLSHFRILSKLGEGGMGVVYLAEDERLKRKVALKVLPPELVADEERRLRFLREARVAASVSHPNIAAIYEIDEAGGIVFIAMELVEGRTLREAIGGRAMPLKEALRVATEIAEGLAHAHQAHVVHRDLKPDNVILRTHLNAKILDFGLAKLLDETAPARAGEDLSRLETISAELMTREGRVFGTAPYMSPEQARGVAVDARSDIFSFGSVLYEMVTGRAPFQGKTATDVLTSVLRDEPASPASVNPEVPPRIEEIVAKCLEKSPDDRYQDTRDLAVDLRKVRRITESGVQTVRTPGSPLQVPSARWRRIAAPGLPRLVLGVVALAVILTGLATLWPLVRPARGFQPRDRIFVAAFENGTGRPELDTGPRESLELMLSDSIFLDVLRGPRREEIFKQAGADPRARIDVETARRVCAQERCEGFLAVLIEPEGEGYRLEGRLHQSGRDEPLFVQRESALDGDSILQAIHRLALGLRRASGENPQYVSATPAPTTRSLAAYYALALERSSSTLPIREAQALLQRAIEIDPGFAEAYADMAINQSNSGDWEAYRESAAEAYRRSEGHSERLRLEYEALHLESLNDHDREAERLATLTRLYPLGGAAHNWLGWLHLVIFEDPIAAEQPLRAALSISPENNLDLLSGLLSMQGSHQEIDALVKQYEARRGIEGEVRRARFQALAARGDWNSVDELIRQVDAREPSELGTPAWRVASRLMTGRLREAREVIPAASAMATKLGDSNLQFESALIGGWLDFRLAGRARPLPDEVLQAAERSLVRLRNLAVFALEVGQSAPLERVLRVHVGRERGSQASFVRDELAFARACLQLIRGDPRGAREPMERLARAREYQRRHHVLACAYEALGMWREAAAEYESVYVHPRYRFLMEGILILDQYRLARAHDRAGDPARARQWYERFVSAWGNGDSDIPEVADARARLAALEAPVPSRSAPQP